MAQWSRLIEQGSNATEGRGFVQWLDVRLAEAWWARAVELSSLASERRVATLPAADQVAHVRLAWEALAYGYQACDLPALGDIRYRRPVEELIGKDVDRLGGLLGKELEPLLPYPVEYCRWLLQYGLNERSELVERTLETSNLDKRNALGRPSWTPWLGIAWREECIRRNAVWDPCIGYTVDLMPPLRNSLVLCRQIAKACADRGPLNTVRETRVAVLKANIKAAREAGVLRGTDDYTRLEGMADEALQSAIHGGNGAWDAYADILDAATPIVTVINPYVGAVVAAIALLFESLRNGILSTGTARITDIFGRDLPVLESSWISGGPGERDRPTHDVPDPPDFVRYMASQPAVTALAPQFAPRVMGAPVSTLVRSSVAGGGGPAAPAAPAAPAGPAAPQASGSEDQSGRSGLSRVMLGTLAVAAGVIVAGTERDH